MFDFETVVDRTDSDSHKWQKYSGKDIIPMWVADMDFPSSPAIRDALHRRIDHGIFGYGAPSPRLKQTIIAHLQTTYRWQVEPNWIVWLPGLVTGLNVACRSWGRPGAGILTTVPVYPPFLTAPAHAGKRLQITKFIFKNQRWQFNWDELRNTIDPGTAMFLLCTPHNPTGRVFTRSELETLADICLRSRLVICSDEIHCDLVLESGCRHIPMATISPEVANRTITLMAPSKTYNIPGLGCAFAIVSNPKLRMRFKRAMAGIVPHINVLGFIAALAAYEHGGPWLRELIDYLRKNRDCVFQRVNQWTGLHMAQVEATYLAWIDVRSIEETNHTAMFEKGGVGLSDGAAFGTPGFVRLNFGCSRILLEKALDRMACTIVKHKANRSTPTSLLTSDLK